MMKQEQKIAAKQWENASCCLAYWSRDLPTKGDVYLLSNEVWEPNIFATLSATRAAKNAGHIGVSGLQNFDIVAARQSNFLVFINHNSAKHNVVNECLQPLKVPSINRKSYCDTICDLSDTIPDEVQLDGREDIKDRLRLELSRPGSFLSSDQSFEHVHQLVRDGRVLNLQIDITDHGSFCPLLGVLNASRLSIDSFYLSNVKMHVDYLSEDPRAPILLAHSLDAVQDLYPEALLIESGIIGHSGKLRVHSPRPIKDRQL